MDLLVAADDRTGAFESAAALLDLVQSTAFFAWANRLMLTLGEPFDDQ